MGNEIKNSVTNRETWIRGLFMLLFVLISGVARLVIAVVVLIQFVSVLFTGSTNTRLLDFGQSLSTYVYQITLYLTFNSEWRPFPFGEWPESRAR
jgi:hypothetical protein